MSTRDFYLARRTIEIPTFVKVLHAVPQAKRDYRPEPRSRSGAELAQLLATEEAALAEMLEKGETRWQEGPPAANVSEIAAAFERSAKAATERLARLDDAAWTSEKGTLLMAGAPPWEDTIENFVWGFFFDALHHRGQLTTYLRPMGGKVPAIYGPSADDPGGS